MIKILFIGDICGKVGRETVKAVLPDLKKDKRIDFIVANAENASGGRGFTRKNLHELSRYGIDFFTSGDHVWRIKDSLEDLNDSALPILRPANFPEDIAYGRGMEIIDLGKKGKVAVINLQGWIFMKELVLDPLRYLDKILEELKGETLAATIVDFHAEVTSEKIILALYADGRVSAVVGTHTHVATCDERILSRGTGFVTDVGMVGPIDSSLWVRKDIAIHNYKFPYKDQFKMETSGRRVFNSVLITIKEGKCTAIQRCDQSIRKTA